MLKKNFDHITLQLETNDKISAYTNKFYTDKVYFGYRFIYVIHFPTKVYILVINALKAFNELPFSFGVTLERLKFINCGITCTTYNYCNSVHVNNCNLKGF